jgi:AcrR family transcriptional regulator
MYCVNLLSELIFRRGILIAVTEHIGHRERKKRRTAQALWETAIALFLEHGFENVTVAQIAQAADVSRMTVFNYFPTKEDLAMRPLEEHVGDAAKVVRERPEAEPAVDALRRDFLARLAARDASTGLNDAPAVLAVRRLVRDTPALADRALSLAARDRDLLAQALADEGAHVTALHRVMAAQLMGAHEELVAESVRRLLAGESADAVYEQARTLAEAAFDQVANGLRARTGEAGRRS